MKIRLSIDYLIQADFMKAIKRMNFVKELLFFINEASVLNIFRALQKSPINYFESRTHARN